MTPSPLTYFLLFHDVIAGGAEVFEFTDISDAMVAFVDFEAIARKELAFKAVLVASDSLETVRITHSNLFDLRSIQEMLDDVQADACDDFLAVVRSGD